MVIKIRCILLNIGHDIVISTPVSIILIIILVCIIVLAIFSREQYIKGKLLHAIESNIDDVYIIYDGYHDKFTYISPNFEKSLGMKQEVLYQDHSSLLELVPEPERQLIMEVIEATMLHKTKKIKFELESVTDIKHWFSIKIYPALERLYVVCITDITKEKEASLLLNETMDNLKKANEAKKEFLSHISHELKTPINAIQGMTVLAQKDIEDKDKLINCLNKVDYASGRLLEMINNILDMSKIDSHKLVLINKPFRMTNLLSELEALVLNQAEIQKKDFKLVLTNYQDDSLIGDSTRLYQILLNCISNALKFTPSGGSIRLEVTEIERNEETVQLKFIISDTGIGMSEEFLEHIFIPFDQEDNSISQIYGGTGLGMPIAKSLVLLMEGNISVESRKHNGTTVTVDIPFTISKSPVEKKPDTGKHVPERHDFSGKLLLVVDDNEINREITCEFLKLFKINVETASSGEEAVRMFGASTPGYYDGILMDIKMPGMDGYETAKAIRRTSHPDAKTICMIALTADGFAEEIESFESGMNFHISKPLNVDDLYPLLGNDTSKDSE